MATGDHGPWIDVHAHPGRCFLRGLSPSSRMASALGGDASEESLTSIGDAGLAAVGFATVADLRAIGRAADGSLRVVRELEPGEAERDNTRQVEALVELAATARTRLVTSATDVERAHTEGTPAIWLTCEGGDFVEGAVGGVQLVHALGVRSITLVHYRPNGLGDLQTEPEVHGGLTDAGRQVIREMNRLGMIVDLAHATEQTTLDALDESEDPVMISHSHLSGAHGGHPRLLSPAHASAVAAHGGLIGAWPSGVTSRTFDDYVEEISRLVDLVGVGHVAVGTDMDANYEPVLTRYGQFETLADALGRRGFDDADVDRVLGGNALDLIRRVCGV